MEPAEKESKPENEEDLTKLLDSCLNDFDKPISKTTVTAKPSATNVASATETSNAASASASAPDALSWTEEFKQFNKMMETYMDDDGEISDMKKWMENLGGGQNPIDADEFAQTFSETLRELTEQAQNIPETAPEELANLLGNMNFDNENVGELSDVMPLMQNVMQKLMSKELLYPSVKEISEKYPEWLQEKQSSLSTKEFDNYKKQYELMLKVVEEFEKEHEDTEAAKKEQFEKVIKLMHKIQNYGNPPKELISNVGPGVPLDEHGNLQIPGMPQQCSIM